MKKELVDYIGSLLFGHTGAADPAQKLYLHSERQFRVNGEGRLEQEQSVLTNIVVDKDAIYLSYLLPDGREACFVNAVKQVDCTMNSDYSIRSITYEAEPVKMEQTDKQHRLLFTLQYEEDSVKFYEANDGDAGKGSKTLFEIC
jgi:hypothetical protein